MRFRSCASALLVGCSVWSLPAAPAGAQESVDGPRPRWQGEVGVAALNSAIGGVTAAVFTGARRLGRTEPGAVRPGWREIRRAFVVGAAGGAVVYGGKRLAGEGFDGSGMLGRQLASVGAAMVRNVGDGRAPLAAVVLPVGPLRVYGGRVGQEGGDRAAARPRWAWRTKLDVGTIVGTALAAAEPGARLDLARSLSAGAPVLVSSQQRLRDACGGGDARACGDMWGPERQGFAAAGAIWLFEPEVHAEGTTSMRALLGHEQVHVVQYDAGLTQWSVPAERWLLARVPGGTWLHHRADLGLSALALGWIGNTIPYEDRPWEREAYFLSRTQSDGYRAPVEAPLPAPLDASAPRP